MWAIIFEESRLDTLYKAVFGTRGSRRERDHWGDLGVNGWIILGWISSRWDVGIWTGLG